MSQHKAEEWKPVPGYEGLYEVSSHGRVRSLSHMTSNHYHNGRVIKGGFVRGYQSMVLSNGKARKTIRVARLVASVFIPNPENKPEVDHIDTNRSNNRIDNLRWVTRIENCNNPTTREHLKVSNRGRNMSLEERHRRSIRAKNEWTHTTLNRRIPILQLNSDSSVVKRWPSQAEACMQLGYSRAEMCRIVKSGTLCKNGYLWVKEKDYVTAMEV